MPNDTRSLIVSLGVVVLAFGTATPLLAADDITFNDLKFDIKPGGKFKREMLTDEIESLHGRVVTIRGFMLSSFQSKGIENFVLLQSQGCPFGGPEATLYHNVIVDMPAGKSTEFTLKPLNVEGRFKIRELKGPSGRVVSIYHIDARSVDR